jgi:DTW domain-containing protein YfiP
VFPSFKTNKENMTAKAKNQRQESSPKEPQDEQQQQQQQQQQQRRPDHDDQSDLREKYQGTELFEQVATRSIQVKEAARSNRCPRCWHDQTLRCICPLIPSIPYATMNMRNMNNTNNNTNNTNNTNYNTIVSKKNKSAAAVVVVRVLVLMHHKEYLSAGDDAKLLLAMLPPENAKLFVFGRIGDWQAFEDEVSKDPIHTVTLWPGEGALTLDDFKNQLPDSSPWKKQLQPPQPKPQPTTTTTTTTTTTPNDGDHATISTPVESSKNNKNINEDEDDDLLPTLRVIVLDGVYSHARNMFKTMKKRLRQNFPKFVALHPDTVSVYHRAQKNYGTSSAQTVANSKDPLALHICTVEAYALLLKELGVVVLGVSPPSDDGDDDDDVTDALVKAVTINNDALVHSIDVRPVSGIPTSKSSGAAKRSRRKQEANEDGKKSSICS